MTLSAAEHLFNVLVDVSLSSLLCKQKEDIRGYYTGVRLFTSQGSAIFWQISQSYLLFKENIDKNK